MLSADPTFQIILLSQRVLIILLSQRVLEITNVTIVFSTLLNLICFILEFGSNMTMLKTMKNKIC